MMVTSNGIPGYRIDAVFGEVFATTVRPGSGSGLWRSFGGSDESGQLRLAHESRQHVLSELWDAAQRTGGNAVVGLRFDSAQVGQGSEVCAYGTAVRIVPMGEGEPGATQQSIAEDMGHGGPATPQPNWPTMGHMEFEEGQRPGAGERPDAARPADSPTPAQHSPARDEQAQTYVQPDPSLAPPTQPIPAQSGPEDQPEERQGPGQPGPEQARFEQAPPEHGQPAHPEPEQGDARHPRTPQQQRPNGDGSWLDLG